jgi:aspartyl-tRNA(Asn)/glutamyl-tRNA(Gln) amidotransferase subunit B
VQETRLYDPDRDETRSMRSKEDAHDYRYFPDPDLPPLVVDAERLIERVRAAMPELPGAMRERFSASSGCRLRRGDADRQPGRLAAYFEAVAALPVAAQAKPPPTG